MDTQEFFTRVVAPTGHLVLAAVRALPTGKGIFFNVGNFDAVSAAAETAKLDAKPDLTIYFAVGTHENNVLGGKVLRRKATAAWFKSLALDLDCGPGKPYATQKDGAAALYAALATFGFPDPLLVSSGNGLHVYWPLVQPIPAARWEKVAMALRLALRDGGVQIDESKIHDASMVLRPVGSSHKKQMPWKPVELLLDCPDYDNQFLESKLVQWAGAAIPTKITPARTLSPLAANLLGGGFEPLDIDAVAKGCNQIATLLASGGATDASGADVKEPMWRASLGVAKFATDPQDAVIRLCGQHPDFDLQQNLDKMANWGGTGVTTCAQFEQHCPAGCAGCPSKGQIKSPAALNAQTKVSITATTPANATTGASAFQTAYDSIQLPPGYLFANRKLYKEIEKEHTTKDAAGKKQTTMVMERQLVCQHRVVMLGWSATDRNMTKSFARCVYEYPIGGWKEFDIPAESLVGNDLSKFLSNKQISLPEKAVNQLRYYMFDFLNYIQTFQTSGFDTTSFGWQPDGGFLHGKNMIGANGGPPWRLTSELDKMAAHIGTVGDRATWIDVTKLLDAPDARLMAFSMLVAGSGLIMPGSGLNCYLYSLHSGDTGTGKSFSLQLGNTLFGHPNALLMQPNDTENALYRTMGSLGSLSAAMDEITHMEDDRAASFALQAQTGREKRRLDANAVPRETVSWCAPIRVTTNNSLLNLYDNRHANNEAESVRTLELRMDDKSWVSRHDVQALIRVLEDNHGFAVPEIAAEVMRRGTLRDVYDAAEAQFKKEFPNFAFTGDERYYAAGVVSAYGIGCIGRDLGLFQFDIEESVDAVLEQVEALRVRRVGKRQDCFDSIGQFLTEFSDRILYVREDRTNASAPKPQIPIPELVYIRMEIVQDKANLLLPGSKLIINSQKLRDWTKKMKTDYAGLIKRLEADGALIDNDRVYIYKGTYTANPAQPWCVVLDLTHARFATVITNAKTALSTNTNLALLQGGKPPAP